MSAGRLLRFGHTDIQLIEGQPLDHPSEALYVAVNARAVLASGLAGAIRLAAGQDVERELRLQGNLQVGSAYLTGPGRLESRGVRRIACGVTAPEPGVAPRRNAVEEALGSALIRLHDERTRSVTMPEIATRVPGLTLSQAAAILTNGLAGAIRRGSSIERVTIVGLHPEYLRAVRDALTQEGASLG